ncbi:MAG: pyruvate ferredoxin oxidoreductase [Candidatus Korarchaeota archaeon]|nr:pyruvate ferredoxin oxidoreductase [Candidatus Korarchaeota archaeon]NIU83104.1 pyruvate ferredoxin oxidoreductase [Candidatus Thorarchaeota archaeon]NIW13482.1 pyruvate ferredoxin oxidoreductase [Candidatus Thorarchaeota archaeon]
MKQTTTRTRNEIIFGGFGGQGIITAGYITGKASAVYDGKDSTLTRVYGPEARGSACRSSVVIEEEKVSYPYVQEPEIMIIMSKDAYEKYLSRLNEGGTLIVDSSLVSLDERAEKYKVYKVPATQIAEDMGVRIIANVIMLGFLSEIWKGVSVEAMRKSVKDTVPQKYVELNVKAFEKGVELAKEAKKA